MDILLYLNKVNQPENVEFLLRSNKYWHLIQIYKSCFGCVQISEFSKITRVTLLERYEEVSKRFNNYFGRIIKKIKKLTALKSKSE